MGDDRRRTDERRLDLSGTGLDVRSAGLAKAAALAYAEAGWPVIPIAGLVNGVCGCRHRAACEHPVKHPLIPGGTTGATTDRRHIREWWGYWPTAGVGIVTGHRSGLAVLDIDPRHGGNDTLAELHQRGLVLPPTLTAETGGGGRHFVYATTTRVGNTSGRLTGAGPTPGIDLRGEGGYIVAPPSRHISNGTYRWQTGSPPPAPLPTWVTTNPTHRAAAAAAASAAGLGASRVGYGQRAIAGEAARVRQAPEGVRNDTLNRAAFSLGTLVGADLITRTDVEAALGAAAAAAGIPDAEAARTITSGLTSGITRPRILESTLSTPRDPAQTPTGGTAPRGPMPRPPVNTGHVTRRR